MPDFMQFLKMTAFHSQWGLEAIERLANMFFDVVANCTYHIRVPQDFLCQNLLFSKTF